MYIVTHALYIHVHVADSPGSVYTVTHALTVLVHTLHYMCIHYIFLTESLNLFTSL